MNEQRIKETGLIMKFLDGTITSEEKAFLFEWLSKDKKNQKTLFEYKNLWDVSSPAFDQQSVNPVAAYRNNVKKRAEKDKERQNAILLRNLQRTAAVLLLPALAVITFLLVSRSPEPYDGSQYMTVIAPAGTRSMLTLPDGSQAWLNSGSSLKYPVVFRPGERKVELSGEAFFEVAADTKNPFSVSFAGITVYATGTAFNIEAFPNDSIIAVTLVEGTVDVKWLENNVGITENQRIVFDSSSLSHRLYIGDTYKWCAWKDGILVFRGDTMAYVFKRLGQTYNIDFTVDKALHHYTYHATFGSESLNEILDMLRETAPISYRKHPADKYYAEGKPVRQRIEVFSTSQ